MSVRSAKREIQRLVNNDQSVNTIVAQVRQVVAEVNEGKWHDDMPLTPIHTIGQVRATSNRSTNEEIMSHVVASFIGRIARFIMLEHNVQPASLEAITLLEETNVLDQRVLARLISH